MSIKKVIKHLFLIAVILFALTINAKAFLGEDTGINLYKNIDQGLYDLEVKLFQKELRGGDASKEISDNLNRFVMEFYNLPPCFNENISIISKDDIIETAQIYNFIDDACKDGEGNVAISSINSYQKAINDFIKYSDNISKEKTKNIYQISRIGLYSDGDQDNSPFDIITDLQEIDKIIFGEELKYEGEEQGFLKNFENYPYISPVSVSDYNLDYYNNNYKINNSDLLKQLNLNLEACENQSGLSLNDLNELIGTGENSDSDGNTSSGYLSNPEFMGVNFNGTGYNSANDNSMWPCNNFFCIKINFATYNYSVLGYGETKSIQGVLEKSNEHLKKGANTSLQQSKMTTNNFEFSLRDVDFASMFHLGVVIQTKSPPLLDLENAIESDNIPKNYKDARTSISIGVAEKLREYYKNLGLDYDRANDLSIYSKYEQELKNIISSAELNPNFLLAKEEELRKIEEIKAKQNEYINDSIDKKINKDILKEFNLEFVELEKFTGSLKDYVDTLYGLIKKLNEIPIFVE
ncbi:MAG: hypothetical protein PHH06_00520 [Candidatus Gracilibacteria bacterium]|nr:hypothetical protein [Candidatus Gracilibacteria bacterium]